MGRGAALDDRTESLHGNSADIFGGCQKLQVEVRELFEQKLGNAGTRLKCSIKALSGRELHLEPLQVNALVGIASFALGAFAAREKRAVGALEELNSLTQSRRLNQPPNPLNSLETTYLQGQSTVENWRGHKWLHQDGYLRVPMHKDGASWWHDPEQNLTWVKTSHYLESRSNGGSFFRTYKNGGIQIRFSNGHEFYESSFPERRKIVLSTGKIDCRAQQSGILSAEDSDLENSLKKKGR